jgi:hypothetical protein
MTEYNENFEIVLYYNCSIISKPIKPSFEDVKSSNPKLNTNQILDIYSKLLNKYKEEISQLKQMDDIIVSSYIFIEEDKNFMSNVKKFEENEFFIEWQDDTKKIIKEVLLNLK